MLEQIKKAIFAKYKETDILWVFVSSYDKNWNLISSNGSLSPDKNMLQLVELLYHGIVEWEKDVKNIAIDVVTETQKEGNMQELMKLSPNEYGFCLIAADGKKSGVILPNTQWVTNAQQALVLIKQKYGLTGNVTIYIFKTERFGI